MLQHTPCGRAEQSTLCQKYPPFFLALSVFGAAVNPRHEDYNTSYDRCNTSPPSLCGAKTHTSFRHSVLVSFVKVPVATLHLPSWVGGPGHKRAIVPPYNILEVE